MRILALAGWLPVALVGATDASITPGVVEVDLVFPRNDSYAPTPVLPVVFAVQNSALAPSIAPYISLTIWNWNNMSDTIVTDHFVLTWENFSSSDPFFVHHSYTGFNNEGNWWLTWHVVYQSCTEESLQSPFSRRRIITNSTGWSIGFTTENSTRELDVAAAINDKKSCSEQLHLERLGVAVNVTNALRVPDSASSEWLGRGDMCAVVASATPTPDPCRATMDSAAAASISSAVAARLCALRDPTLSCPPKDERGENTAQQLAVGGLACLAAAFGALSYILM